MPSYLCIKANNSTKKYELKNSANKPYLRVGTIGYLPLTTETTSGLHINVKCDGSKYRIIETYTTSREITVTTNTSYLTTQSTYSTTYGTRASTSSTTYGTRKSTSSTDVWNKEVNI